MAPEDAAALGQAIEFRVDRLFDPIGQLLDEKGALQGFSL